MLQVFATMLWFAHISYLRDDHSSHQFELGVQAGREKLQDEIIQNGGEIPATVSAYRDKDEMLNLGESIHAFLVFYPLVIMQGIALILLMALAFSHSCKPKVSHNNTE